MSDQTYLGADNGLGGHHEGDGAENAGSGVEGIIDELVDIIGTAKSVPLSSSVMVSRDEVLELLEAAREEMPEELRRAKRLLKDREEVFASARREAAEITDDARVQAERMVQRTEIVRQAEYQAIRIVEDAEAESRRLTHEAEDYVDQKLAGFEIVLDRTMKTVRAGRERLAAVPADPYGDDAVGESPGLAGRRPGDSDAAGSGTPSDIEPLFDQDTE
ncbi:MAG: ATP synthase F0 subunit B [Acidimicrobiales bacterium]